MVDEVIPYEDAPRRLLGRVVVRLRRDELDDELIDDLLAVIKASPGIADVYFRVERNGESEVLVRAGTDVRTGPGPELAADVEAVLGPGRLSVEPYRQRFEPSEEARMGRRRRERFAAKSG